MQTARAPGGQSCEETIGLRVSTPLVDFKMKEVDSKRKRANGVANRDRKKNK